MPNQIFPVTSLQYKLVSGTVLVFLEINGFMADCTDDELIQLAIGLAAGQIDDRQLLDWIIDHV